MKRSSVVLVLLSLLYLSACVSFIGGPWGISPSQFQFRPIVPRRTPGPGGWKSARVSIQLVHVTEQGVHKNVWCHIEVEVPELNYLGVVTDEVAQWEAARSSDIASERVLKQEGLFSAELCNRFREEMMKEMEGNIPGTRVIKAL